MHKDRPFIAPPLECTFDQVYECISKLPDKKVQKLFTASGKEFEATIKESPDVGKYILFSYGNIVYPCCWGNTRNHMKSGGQRIGQYSIPLDKWCKSQM